MERLPKFEAGWKGTLYRKVFGVSTNEVGRNAFSNESGLVPHKGTRMVKKVRVE
jgi:hypothetical protein